MHPDWQNFLKNEKTVTDEIENIITDLSHFDLIEVTGKDATNFLNGQFTTNIKELSEHHLQFSAWCNPKGQVKTTFFIYRHKTGFNILLPKELKDSFLKKLQMYIMRADVKLIDKSDELVKVGIQTNNKKLLAKFIQAVPEQQGEITTQDDLHCSQTYSPENNEAQRYIFIGSAEKLIILWKEISQECTPVDTAIWECLDIKAAYPWLSLQTTEKFLPQMLNMDLIDGLNYQKGCYPGQEIIARLHFRGQLKRSLFLATCPSDTSPIIGDQLFVNDVETGVGSVINVNFFKEQCYLLIVIERAMMKNELSLREPNANKINLQALPYESNETSN